MTKEEKREYDKKYRKLNKEKKKQQDKIYREKNKDKIKSYFEVNSDKLKQYRKEYRKKNKTKHNNYIRNRLLTDNLFKLKINIGNLVRISLKRYGFKKGSKTNDILGCSFQEFKLHLEKQFEPWMHWNNYGLYNGDMNYGWDIDHIIPVSSAKTEEEIIRLNHYTNLKPLCSYTNRYLKRNLNKLG